jgi:hypothetical protein
MRVHVILREVLGSNAAATPLGLTVNQGCSSVLPAKRKSNLTFVTPPTLYQDIGNSTSLSARKCE